MGTCLVLLGLYLLPLTFYFGVYRPVPVPLAKAGAGLDNCGVVLERENPPPGWWLTIFTVDRNFGVRGVTALLLRSLATPILRCAGPAGPSRRSPALGGSR
jgi:hypothetical protein